MRLPKFPNFGWTRWIFVLYFSSLIIYIFYVRNIKLMIQIFLLFRYRSLLNFSVDRIYNNPWVFIIYNVRPTKSCNTIPKQILRYIKTICCKNNLLVIDSKYLTWCEVGKTSLASTFLLLMIKWNKRATNKYWFFFLFETNYYPISSWG